MKYNPPMACDGWGGATHSFQPISFSHHRFGSCAVVVFVVGCRRRYKGGVDNDCDDVDGDAVMVKMYIEECRWGAGG